MIVHTICEVFMKQLYRLEYKHDVRIDYIRVYLQNEGRVFAEE